MNCSVMEEQYTYTGNSWDILFVYPKHPIFIMIKKDALYCEIESFEIKYFILFFFNFSIIYSRYLVDLVALDYPDKIKRFKLVYLLKSLINSLKLFVTIFIKNFQKVCSLRLIFNSINWLEREAWDMYGIDFYNNNDLRRILTDYNFKGHPLRKDFPLSGFYELAYSKKFAVTIYKKIELMQEMRFYSAETNWDSSADSIGL